MSEVRAALRDASGYRTHRLIDTATLGHIPCYHVVRPDEPYLSGCGRIISPDTEIAAVGVMHRCSRTGCRERWP